MEWNQEPKNTDPAENTQAGDFPQTEPAPEETQKTEEQQSAAPNEKTEPETVAENPENKSAAPQSEFHEKREGAGPARSYDSGPYDRQYGAFYNRPGDNRAQGPHTPTGGAYQPYSYQAPGSGGYAGYAYGAAGQGHTAGPQQQAPFTPPPKKKKSGAKVLVICLCAVLAVVLLVGGGIAGSYLYYYYNNPTTLQPVNPGTTPSTTPNPGVGSGATLDIKPAPDESGSLPASGTELSVEQIAEKVTPSVVGIVAQSLTNSYGDSSGSGIIMSEDGYILTNNHVIEGADRISVVLDNGDDYVATVVGTDERTDLAVIKVDAQDLPAAEFGDSDALKAGSLAVAIGNPMGLELQGTVTQGCVSAPNREMAIDGQTMKLIQTDAAINPGNSGGPLVNKYGQVVGINSVKLGISYYEGLGFAIPINTAKPIVDELIAYGYIKGRPAIGITGASVSERAANYYGIPVGVLVDSVNSFSDAAQQGLRAGDIITAVNGETVADMTALSEMKDRFVAGDQITVTVYRDGQTMNISFRLMDEAELSRQSAS